jgi:hypothetical protein
MQFITKENLSTLLYLDIWYISGCWVFCCVAPSNRTIYINESLIDTLVADSFRFTHREHYWKHFQCQVMFG